MTLKKWTNDSFVLGLLAGAVVLTLSYFLFEFIRLGMADYYGNPYIFPAPRVQLFSILVNIILFRFLLIRFQREQTAKGILFITVILSFAYFYYFFRYTHR